MNAYETEMYKFLTQEENFRNMLRIMDQFDSIRKQLIRDFWQEVKKELEEKCEGTEWKVQYNSHSPFSNYWGLQLFRNNWTYNDRLALCIGCEPLHQYCNYGVWIQQNSGIPKKDELRKALRSHEIAKQFKQDKGQWWPFWQQGPIDFSNQHHLIRLIPSNRESHVMDYVQLVWDLKTNLGKFMDKQFKQLT